MRPNETFSYLKNNQVPHDLVSLARYYQPIMGSQSLALYAYFLAFDDQGASPHHFSEVLNHLNMGMPEFEKHLNVLAALKLLNVYQQASGYLLQLQSPMAGQDFIKNQVLATLLEKKIGEAAFKQLTITLPLTAKLIPKSLSQVFKESEDLTLTKSDATQSDFDVTNFKSLMARDQLRFEDEKETILELFSYAELAKKTWYETYQIAKATAVDGLISTKRMFNSLTPQTPVQGEFSEAEKELIRWAKARKPSEFLSDVKSSRQAAIMPSERQVLKQMAQLGLMDAVINVLVLYAFNKTNSANLNEKYVLKLGNEFSYKKIHSAEAAVLTIREMSKDQPTKTRQGKTTKTKSNVPDWSKEDYRTQATPEELERLEALRRRVLGDKET